MRRHLLPAGLAIVAALTTPLATRAQDKDNPKAIDLASSIYAACELGLGGAPLSSRLFQNGWPTTKDYRRLVSEHANGAFRDGIAAELGSGLGLPLSLSAYARGRGEQKKSSAEAAIADRVKLFGRVGGLNTPDKWEPVFLPWRRGEATLAKAWNEQDPSTWALAAGKAEKTIDLRTVGFAIYGQALLAEQELPDDKPRLDGFVALCALDAGIAAMHELRTALVLDKEALGGMPPIATFNPREQPSIYFPHLVEVEIKGPRALYKLAAKEDPKASRLGDQAALLLGLSELSLACDANQRANARYFGDITIDGRKMPPLFEKSEQQTAAEVACFVLQSSRTLHIDGARLRFVSIGTPESAGEKLLPEDLGLYLLAMETFVAAVDKLRSPPGALQEGKKVALNLADEVGKILIKLQAESLDGSFSEAYSYGGDAPTPTNRKKPLAANGLAARGLLAAARLPAPPSSPGQRPNFLEAAQTTLKFLEKARWDQSRHAFVESPGQRGQKVTAVDAASVLGALRDAALATQDARYLIRYKDYLESLRARGFQRSETARQGETGADGGDSDKDGVKSPTAAGLAPFASDVVFP